MPIFGLRRLSSGVQAKLAARKGSIDPRDAPPKTGTTTISGDNVVSLPSIKFDDREPRRSRPPAIFSVNGARKSSEDDKPDTDPPSAWYGTSEPSDDEGLSTTTSVTDDAWSGPVTPLSSPKLPAPAFATVSSSAEYVADHVAAPEALSLQVVPLKDDQSLDETLPPAEDSHQSQDEQLSPKQTENPDQLQTLMTRLPTELLIHIARHLDPCSAAYFCISNRSLSARLGPDFYPPLNEPTNLSHRLRFLAFMDASMPSHLLCHTCAVFHLRQPRSLHLKSDAIAEKPLVTCPRSLHTSAARITVDRRLRFSLAHAVMRAHRLGPTYGPPVQALRHAWTTDTSTWSHASQWLHKMRALIMGDHLIIRIQSTASVAPGLTLSEIRRTLSSRDDYSAMYSTCPHWTHGAALASIAKCALRHIPPGPGARPPSQCAECRPLRRCSECATEYLVEVKLREDKTHPDQFRHAIVVTRWTDLGEVKEPGDEEWYAATEADPKWGEGRYSPFEERMRGRKSLRARFEMAEQVRRVHEGPALVLRQRRLWASEVDAPWRE